MNEDINTDLNNLIAWHHNIEKYQSYVFTKTDCVINFSVQQVAAGLLNNTS